MTAWRGEDDCEDSRNEEDRWQLEKQMPKPKTSGPHAIGILVGLHARCALPTRIEGEKGGPNGERERKECYPLDPICGRREIGSGEERERRDDVVTIRAGISIEVDIVEHVENRQTDVSPVKDKLAPWQKTACDHPQ